ncbi:MAG: glycosyltransferase family 87 protein [Candidatus Binatia bacterium]
MQRIERLVPWALLVFVVAGGVSWIQRPGDLAGYLVVGEAVLAGQHIYQDVGAGVNTWPPFFSLLCVPLALLARPTPYVARGVWLLLNFLLLWAALKMLTRLVYGSALRLRPSGADLSLASPEVLIPVALCYRFILSNFDHLQVNIVIFTAALAGLYWHTCGRDVCGGAALGLAAAMKVMPAAFIPYLVYRRRYRLALCAGIATVAFSLLPVLIYGWPRFLDYVRAWRQAVALGWGVGKMNQSVYAMFDRYLGHGITPLHVTVTNVLTDSGDPVVAVATGAVLALVVALGLLLFRGAEARNSVASLAEYSVVFVVSALFGPVTWKAYLVVLLCPCMLLVGLIRGKRLTLRERRTTMAGLAAYFILGGLTTRGFLGRQLAGALAMLSVTTLGALVVLGVLLWLRPRIGERSMNQDAGGLPPAAAGGRG